MYAGAWRPVAAPDLAATVADVAQRAFWDAVAQQTSEGNYAALFSVLGEIEESMRAMLAYSAERQAELRDHFDPAFLRQQVEHGALERAEILRLMDFLATRLAEWHAAADAADARDWVASVKRATASAPDDVGALLVAVLIPFLATWRACRPCTGASCSEEIRRFFHGLRVARRM